MRPTLLVRVAAGDITRWRSDAIATSANAGLCGNKTPSYWRFREKRDRDPDGAIGCVRLEEGKPYANVDGQVHEAAGPELASSLALLARTSGTILKGGSGTWRGSLLPSSTGGLVACPAGSAVRTPSFGALRQYTDSVVHVVAPDGRHQSHWTASGTLPLLRNAFIAAIAQAEEAGAASLAVPSIGCGVNGWPPPVAARAALDSVEAWAARDGGAGTSTSLRRIDFVLLGASELAAWRRVASDIFGEVHEAGDDGVHSWSLSFL